MNQTGFSHSEVTSHVQASSFLFFAEAVAAASGAAGAAGARASARESARASDGRGRRRMSAAGRRGVVRIPSGGFRFHVDDLVQGGLGSLNSQLWLGLQDHIC